MREIENLRRPVEAKVASMKILRIGATLLFLSAAFAAFAGEPEVGQPAPVLKATELNGQDFDLAEQRGKVVIVNFWATWCGPCRVEMPALDAFYRAFRDRGLVLIGISVDRWSDRGKVAAVMRDFSYPAAMGNEAKADDFPRPKEIPITYVIGRDGVLRRIMRPDRIEITPKTLAETVLPLLKEKTAPPPSSMSASAR
jgi:cytochrome c biogenesis protein CcmG, thiol:disulfide interchange protein DsbE